MAFNVQNTNYNGEVLEKILTLAATGNELVEKGLIHIEPNVASTFNIPRIKATTMLQKRKTMPTVNDSRGDIDYSERVLEPRTFMAFTTFNPHSFESIWRQWQPKGNLVFTELPAEVQNTLIEAVSKQVKFELGGHFINGTEGNGDNQLFNGIVYRMESDTDKVVVNSTETSVIGKLNDLYDAIPDELIDNANLRIIISTHDARKYGKELISQTYKGIDYTDIAPDNFRGVKIERLSQWPSDLFVATIASTDLNSNLYAAVNLVDDFNVIQIDKVNNAGELYFFKLLMKADTQIAFGEEVIWLDSREVEEEEVIEDPNPGDEIQ